MFICSPSDTVSRADLVVAHMADMGGVVESLQIARNQSGSNHALAVQIITDLLIRNLDTSMDEHTAPALSQAGSRSGPAARTASSPPTGR